MNLQESIRLDLDKIFSERSEPIVENDLDERSTYILEMTIKCAFDGTLEEAQEKMHGDFESFEAGENITDDWVPVDTDITRQGRRDESINEASGSTSEDDMVELLNNKFPGCKAVSTEEWDGRAGGIWFRGTESCEINELPIYNQEVFADTMGVNPALEKLLSYHGWYGEPYDSGTLMAYPV